jgi:hypothetical protein
MKKLILITWLLILSACDSGEEKEKILHRKYPVIDQIETRYYDRVYIHEYVIDGCAYIGTVNYHYGDFLTHKGNCKNPIHKNGR